MSLLPAPKPTLGSSEPPRTELGGYCPQIPQLLTPNTTPVPLSNLCSSRFPAGPPKCPFCPPKPTLESSQPPWYPQNQTGGYCPQIPQLLTPNPTPIPQSVLWTSGLPAGPPNVPFAPQNPPWDPQNPPGQNWGVLPPNTPNPTPNPPQIPPPSHSPHCAAQGFLQDPHMFLLPPPKPTLGSSEPPRTKLGGTAPKYPNC